MIRTQTALMLVLILALTGLGSAAFVDNFNNGNVNNSDTINGFWTATTSAAESGGNFKCNYNTDWSERGIASSSTDNTFNFWTHPVTVEVRGLNMYGTAGTRTDYNYNHIFAFTSEAGVVERSSEDAIVFAIRGRYYSNLAWKAEDGGNSVTHYHSPATGSKIFTNDTHGGLARAYDITLDGTSGVVQYDISVFGNTDGTNLLKNYVGSLPATLTEALWSNNGNSSQSAIGIQSFNQSGGGYSYNLVDSLTVVPEPATLGLLGIGGLAMLRRRRK